MTACLSGRFRPNYAPVICNHGPKPRGISETLAFCIVKPCQNPHTAVKLLPFPHMQFIFSLYCLFAYITQIPCISPSLRNNAKVKTLIITTATPGAGRGYKRQVHKRSLVTEFADSITTVGLARFFLKNCYQ